MKDNNCAYCMEGEMLEEFAYKICELKASNVHFLKEQSHPGRCIVACKEHVGDITELTPEVRSQYFEDIAKVSRAIANIYHPDKINYGSYHDLGHHVHFHLVPKYKDEFEWGGVFAMAPGRVYLSEEEYKDAVAKLRAALTE